VIREPKACVVVPCFNEEQRLDGVRVVAFVAAHPEIRLLFVDDGSTDGTAPLLKRLREMAPEKGAIEVMVLPHNGGKAEAVRQGMLHAVAMSPAPVYTGFWDADLATPLDTIPVFHSILEANPNLSAVFGARVKLLGRSIERRLLRHYFGRIFATVASAVLRIPIYDTQCGAKLFRVDDDLREVLAQPFLSRWIFDVEIVARYAQLRRRSPDRPAADQIIYEYPLEQWHDIKGSKLRLHDFLRAAVDLIRIQRHYKS
jgi:dolichyl-phosphate beta-glucosyltransferase